MSNTQPLLKAESLTKNYNQGKLEILRGVNLELHKGEAISIVGASGSGKSTLLHILGTLDRPNSGQLYFKGEDISQQTDEETSFFRNSSMGFVFQFHHLLNEFTALENVAMPCMVGGIGKSEALQRAEKFLYHLGLEERQGHFPTELSGGEQQRVAIARALVMKPEILFADEPTGNLDPETRNTIQELFFELHKNLDLTIVVVTHDRSFANSFPKTLEMKNGLLINA